MGLGCRPIRDSYHLPPLQVELIPQVEVEVAVVSATRELVYITTSPSAMVNVIVAPGVHELLDCTQLSTGDTQNVTE